VPHTHWECGNPARICVTPAADRTFTVRRRLAVGPDDLVQDAGLV
jgi:hypothetical protein